MLSHNSLSGTLKKKAIFQAKNTNILQYLQLSLAKVLGLVIDNLSPLY